jgi:hypothetical protein
VLSRAQNSSISILRRQNKCDRSNPQAYGPNKFSNAEMQEVIRSNCESTSLFSLSTIDFHHISSLIIESFRIFVGLFTEHQERGTHNCRLYLVPQFREKLNLLQNRETVENPGRGGSRDSNETMIHKNSGSFDRFLFFFFSFRHLFKILGSE